MLLYKLNFYDKIALMSDYQNLINLLNYKVLDHLENMIYPLMAMFDKFYQRQVQRQKLQILFAKKLKRKN